MGIGELRIHLPVEGFNALVSQLIDATGGSLDQTAASVWRYLNMSVNPMMLDKSVSDPADDRYGFHYVAQQLALAICSGSLIQDTSKTC